MRNFLLLVFTLLIFSFPSFSQSKKAQKHISILTADSLAGRGFTKGGQTKAANYIISELKKLNVNPSGENQFKQELSYPVNTFPGMVQFSTSIAGTTKIYGAGSDYLFHPSSNRIDIEGKIEIIDTTYLFDKIESKNIYYIDHKPKNPFIEKFLFESASQNSLLIVRDTAKWSWFPSDKQSQNTIMYVKDELKSGVEVKVSNEAEFIPNFRSSNIIGKINGDRSDSIIVFTAHYDHIGQMGSAIFKGANDNASGVSMLLSLAEYYSKNTPLYDTYFLFTTAEEVGLIGSYYFIQNPTFDLRKTKMLINLDMVGTGDEGITVVNAVKQKAFYNTLTELNQGKISQIKKRGKACNSDHCLFDQIGVPAIFIYTLGGKQAYHDVFDDGKDLSLEAFNSLHDLLIESVNSY